jgi:hypothetical protein
MVEGVLILVGVTSYVRGRCCNSASPFFCIERSELILIAEVLG